MPRDRRAPCSDAGMTIILTKLTELRRVALVPNDVLRRALVDAKLTERQLAERIGADPATVSRWVSDATRTPQPRLRWAVADALGVDEMSLWPNATRAMIKTGPDREIHHVYLSSPAVPGERWVDLISNATRDIAVSAFSCYFLWNLIPDLSTKLRAKVADGCRVRFIIGDPGNPLVEADEAATGVPLKLTTRIAQTRHMLEPLRDIVEGRESTLGYGRSVFRGDNDALLSIWPHGIWGGDYPVLHLRRRQDDGIFDQMAVRHVDRLWEDATPVWPTGD